VRISPDQDIPAVFLVGGMGTRLRSIIASTPKPLASIGSEAFLQLLVRQLRAQGIRRLVMCTGYGADQVEAEFSSGYKYDVEIAYSREATPLGTGGAVKLAQKHLEDAADFLVLNGDSLVEMDFGEMLDYHRQCGGIASMAVRKVEDVARYGTVEMSPDGRVTAFVEKTGSAVPGMINAGVYVFNKEVFQHIPDGPASLEKDVFPSLLDGGIYALEQHGLFIDIGTPEDYARAQELCERLKEAANSVPTRGV
jgi:D-glycero-alpha-D-manno-heptose 1-phosphate guanylyltransferase